VEHWLSLKVEKRTLTHKTSKESRGKLRYEKVKMHFKQEEENVASLNKLALGHRSIELNSWKPAMAPLNASP
jgi:hypothetical protein